MRPQWNKKNRDGRWPSLFLRFGPGAQAAQGLGGQEEQGGQIGQGHEGVAQVHQLPQGIMNTGKTYEAEITLGVETTTQDSSGEVTARQSVDFNEEKIEQAVYSFKGDYMQIPPMYSAVKVNGKKLYELARKGQEIERKARKVEIRDISIIEFMPPDKIKISVDCSKGTYIRTLAADIGIKLGCGA